MNGKLFLRFEGRQIASSMETNKFGQLIIALLKISTDEQNDTEQKLYLVTTNTVTIPSHYISLVPFKAINQAINTKIQSEKKHDHWLCKESDYMEDGSPEPPGMVEK